MTNQIHVTACISMSLSDVQGHSPIASVFEWDFLYSCAAVDTISTDTVSHGPSATAELLVKVVWKSCYLPCHFGVLLSLLSAISSCQSKWRQMEVEMSYFTDCTSQTPSHTPTPSQHLWHCHTTLVSVAPPMHFKQVQREVKSAKEFLTRQSLETWLKTCSV